MKKFDLEAAKKGAPVVTKKGKEAHILYFERDNPKFPLVVIIEKKHVYCFTAEGKFYVDKLSDSDLKMKG